MAQFKCSICGTLFPASTLIWCCEKCGGPLNASGTPLLRRSDIATERASLWRYQQALIHQGPVPVSLGEGWTPLVRSQWNGAGISWKCEFVSISGSFKDRGVSVMINHLLANGVTKVAEDLSGNGGAAVATYAAAAGLPCRIYVPAHTSPSKITQIAATGADVIRISGSRQAVADAAMADTSGYFYASHNWDPAFLDGIKTVGYEIWEQSGFAVPDAIVAPTGGGSNLLGCFRAFSELRKAGEVDQLPRLYGAQSESCQPIARGFETGAETYVEVEIGPSIAEGIAVSRPVRSRELLAAVRESAGAIHAVSEAAIVAAHDQLARSGFYVEPTTATAAALLDRLIRQGTIRAGEHVVVILTGSGLKAGELITRMRDGAIAVSR
jgi:threonine synthase